MYVLNQQVRLKRDLHLKEGEGEYKLTPLTEVGTAVPHDPHLATLSAIIEKMNELFAGDLSEADLVTYAQHISGRLLENDVLAKQAATNSKEQFALGDFSGAFMDTVIEGLDRYQSMAEQVLTNDRTRKGFEQLVLDMVYRGFEQVHKDRSTGAP